MLVDRHVTCAASQARSQRPALLQAAAQTTASGSTGKEDLKADRRVRHYKEVGLQEWPLAGRATIPGVLYGIGLCMSLRRRTILSKVYGRPLPSSLPFTLFARQTEPQVVVLPLSHGSGRGENLVTIARYVKPLFANMHHPVHAVAGALRNSNDCTPAPRRLRWMASVMVMWSMLSSHSADAIFRRPNEFFSVALFAKNVAIDLKCIENHGGKPW